MFLILHKNRSHSFSTICQWAFLLLTINLTYSQEIFTAQIVLSNLGTEYVPVVMSAQLVSTILADSIKKCAELCTANILCRVYDYGVSISNQCRLFEGDTNTLGQIASSSSTQSIVGTIQLSPNLFAEYGSPCISFCYHSRYLQCGTNFTCECMPHTYWDPSSSMCLPQSPILGSPCEQNLSMCREDLNYTCLQFYECGRKLHKCFCYSILPPLMNTRWRLSQSKAQVYFFSATPLLLYGRAGQKKACDGLWYTRLFMKYHQV